MQDIKISVEPDISTTLLDDEHAARLRAVQATASTSVVDVVCQALQSAGMVRTANAYREVAGNTPAPKVPTFTTNG